MKNNSIKTQTKRILVIGIIGLFIFGSLIGFINFSEDVMADGYGDYPPPIYGDWNITTTTYVKNETIILNGNLTIKNGGVLTLDNVTLTMNCTFDGEFHIEVQSRGGLNILSGSNITAYSASYEFLFWVRSGSSFTMKDSRLSECGYEFGWAGTHSGLYIQTNNALIENNTIIGDENGIVFRYGDSAKIRNNTIIAKDLEGEGILGYSDSSKLEIINNTITAGLTGISLWDTSSNKIISNVIKTTNTKGDDRETGIFLAYSHSDIISNNIILEALKAIEFYQMYGDTIVVNSTLEATDYSFYLWHSESVRVINTTFDKNKVYFVDSNSKIAVQWYLHMNVTDLDGNPVSNASIRVQDNINGTFEESYLTDINGCARWIPCTEYVQNKTSKKYYTPHNITATRSGYIENYAIPEPHMNMSKNVTISLTPDPAPPISTLSTNSSYWNTTGEIEIMYNVSDPSPASGLRDIVVYYNYSVNNNSDWSGWIENWNITFTGSPLFSSGVFVFNCPEGEGYYRLYSIASDTANNQEYTKSIPDLLVAFDKTKPYSQLTQLSTYQNTTIFTINYTQSDGFGSGVKNLSLYYRKNSEENWIKYGDYPSTISQFTFNSSSVGGDGIYEFFVIASDYAGNIESLPETGNETWTIVDTIKPVSSVDMLQYYKNSSSFNI
jgi:hypothetical protein